MTRSPVAPLSLSLALLALALLSAPPTRAEGVAELQKSPLVRAMQDELARSMTLALPGMAKPYFVSYLAREVEQVGIAAEFGGNLVDKHNHTRTLQVSLRVGDYAFDNTNFLGGGSGGRTVLLPLDDDYEAIRQQIWLATDQAYKRAAEGIARKKAALANQTKDKDDSPDFAKVEPLKKVVGSPSKLADSAPYKALVSKLSALLWDYPEVQEGYVALTYSREERTFVSSEGALVAEPSQGAHFVMAAGTQAEDGMPVANYVTFSAESPEGLPDEAALSRAVKRVLDELRALRKAPKVEDYSGPVLFEGEAAPMLMGQILGRNLAGTPSPKSPSGRVGPANDFEGKLGRRVLPRGFTVVDDPRSDSFGKLALLGGYVVDDQGVAAQKVTLIKGGKLKAQLMSRTPSKEQPKSTGHARGYGFGGVGVSPSNLLITARGQPRKKLLRALVKQAKEAGEDYGIVVRQLPNRMATGKLSGVGSSYGAYHGAGMLAFKVDARGKETLVRGLTMNRLETQDLKRIRAAGKTPAVYHQFSFRGFGPRGAGGRIISVVSPPLLIPEVELNETKGGQNKLPLLPRPKR